MPILLNTTGLEQMTKTTFTSGWCGQRGRGRSRPGGSNTPKVFTSVSEVNLTVKGVTGKSTDKQIIPAVRAKDEQLKIRLGI